MALTLPQVESEDDLTPEQARTYFNTQVQALLGISSDEFLARLDAGEYRDMPDDAAHADIVYLSTLQAIGRSSS